MLKRMKIKNPDKCDYCDMIEDITHKFWFCPRAQSLWNELKSWFLQKHLGCFADKIRVREILLGVVDSKIANHCVSAAIQLLSSSHRAISIYLLLGSIENDREAEKYSAAMNGRMEAYENKWALLNNIGIE